MDYVGSVRARLGYVGPSWMIYATGGFAWEGTRFASDLSNGLEEKSIQRRTGWAAGAGFEYAIDPLWTARLEYLHYDFGPADVRLPSGARYASALDFQTLRIGLILKIDWPGSTGGSQPGAARAAPLSDIWEIHGQTTYLSQGYPGFHAPYTGTNSRPAASRRRPGATASISCTVRSLSSTGALLEIIGPVGVPKKCTLVIAADEFRRACRVIWMSEKRLGVIFEMI